MNVNNIRKLNLFWYRKGFKTQREFAEQIDIPATLLSQIKTGKRGIGEDLARKFEIRLGLEKYRLDNPKLIEGETLSIEGKTKLLPNPQNKKINLTTIKPEHYEWRKLASFPYSYNKTKEYKEMSIEKEKIKLPYSEDCFSVSIPEGSFTHELKHECRVLVNPDLEPEPGSNQIALVTFGEHTTFARYKRIADREIYNILEIGYPETFDATGLDPKPETHGVVILRRIDDYPE